MEGETCENLLTVFLTSTLTPKFTWYSGVLLFLYPDFQETQLASGNLRVTKVVTTVLVKTSNKLIEQNIKYKMLKI